MFTSLKPKDQCCRHKKIFRGAHMNKAPPWLEGANRPGKFLDFIPSRLAKIASLEDEMTRNIIIFSSNEDLKKSIIF